MAISTPKADLELLHKRLESMRKARSPYEAHWKQLCTYILPRKDNALWTSKGRTQDQEIWDATPAHALEMLAASIGGMITNPALPWFMLGLRDIDIEENGEARDWLQECRDRMLAVFNSDTSGFQQAAHELYLDNAHLETAVMFVSSDQDIDTGAQGKTEDYGQGKRSEWQAKPRPKVNGGKATKFPPAPGGLDINFRTFPIWECYVSESDKGKVDTVYRVFNITMRQAWDWWGEKCSDKVKDKRLDNPEDEIEICHATYPREVLDKGGLKVAGNMPIACVYYETDGKHLLEESGYHEMPYMVLRWSKKSGEVYGYGPSTTALPFIRALHSIARTELMAAEKMADPPLMVPDDSFLGPVRSGPGGLSYYRGGTNDRIEALPVSVDLSHTEQIIVRYQDAIRSIYLNDKLEFQGDPNQTATEVMARQNEKMRLLGPYLGRVQTEFLGPLINRVFRIMFRAGQLPPVPESLAQLVQERGATKVIKIEYVGPLALEQKSIQVNAAQRALGVLTPLIGQADPFGILDNYDTDALTIWVNDVLGTPADIMRDPTERDKMRQAKSQQAQQAQQGAQIEQAANVAKTLGDTQLGPNTGLSALAGASIPGGTSLMGGGV